jgi:hypothetical protein
MVIWHWQNRIEQLEAENRVLLVQLMAARAQLEHVLATLRQCYESVRAEQDQGAREITN